MKEKELLIKFIHFLKKNGVYQKYVINIQKLHSLAYRAQFGKKVNVIEYILDSLIYENGEFLISDAFQWSDTIEGHTFWKNIHTKWYNANLSL
jgi:hypothetical protein